MNTTNDNSSNISNNCSYETTRSNTEQQQFGCRSLNPRRHQDRQNHTSCKDWCLKSLGFLGIGFLRVLGFRAWGSGYRASQSTDLMFSEAASRTISKLWWKVPGSKTTQGVECRASKYGGGKYRRDALNSTVRYAGIDYEHYKRHTEIAKSPILRPQLLRIPYVDPCKTL